MQALKKRPPRISYFFGWVLLYCPLLCAQSPSQEYQVKGAYIFNFAQFTEWPAVAFESTQSPFVIGILGDDPFGIYLDELVKGEVIKGHPITIRRFDDLESVQSAHILFVADGKGIDFHALQEMANRRNILTISDLDEFTKQGGMVRLFTDSNKVRFEVNLEIARNGGLVFSSKLLRLAELCCDHRR